MVRNRQSRGEATRVEIVNVARQLFSEHGYHNTGIADIQEATGLTKGAFYHHFRTKEDLGLAVVEAARLDYGEHMIAPAMKFDTPGERLVAFLDGVSSLNCQPEWRNCQMLATLSAELSQSDDRLYTAVQDLQGQLYETCRDLIADAQKSKEADDSVGPGVWAQLIVNVLAGTLVIRKIGRTEVEFDRVIGLLKRMLVKAA